MTGTVSNRGDDARAGGADPRPLVVHVVYRFDIGGLENGVVNLLNRMPHDRYRHTVLSLTDVTRFRERVLRDDVTFIELHKPPGHGVKLWPRLRQEFRRLRPAIVHTRNLAALEAVVPAWLTGIPVRIHGEHGRDVGDLDGSNRTYRLVRRLHRPFVSHYVTVSRDLERYLREAIGVRAADATPIVNGVDTERFSPPREHVLPHGWPFASGDTFVCGTVGRLQPVKNQVALARAFVRALALDPSLRARLRLVIVGDGPLREGIVDVLRAANALDLAWLPGARDDVAAILRALDAFVLPSLGEGISNTILEAMASGLPVVATRVGGNPELVDDGRTGTLVRAGDDDALAAALVGFARDAASARAMGSAGRAQALRSYSIDAMVAQYVALYDRLLDRRLARRSDGTASSVGGATTETH